MVGLIFCLSALVGAAEEPKLLAKVTRCGRIEQRFRVPKDETLLLSEQAPKWRRGNRAVFRRELSSTAQQRRM